MSFSSSFTADVLGGVAGTETSEFSLAADMLVGEAMTESCNEEDKPHQK